MVRLISTCTFPAAVLPVVVVESPAAGLLVEVSLSAV